MNSAQDADAHAPADQIGALDLKLVTRRQSSACSDFEADVRDGKFRLVTTRATKEDKERDEKEKAFAERFKKVTIRKSILFLPDLDIGKNSDSKIKHDAMTMKDKPKPVCARKLFGSSEAPDGKKRSMAKQLNKEVNPEGKNAKKGDAIKPIANKK